MPSIPCRATVLWLDVEATALRPSGQTPMASLGFHSALYAREAGGSFSDQRPPGHPAASPSAIGPTVHHAHGANVFTSGTFFGCPLRPILSFSSRPFSSFTQVTYCRRSAGNTAGRVSAVQFRVSFRGRHCLLQRRLRLAHARQFENPLPSWTASAPTGWVPLGAHSSPSTHHTPCRADLPRGHCHQCGHVCASL